MTFNTSVLRMARVLRIVRILRVFRAFEFVEELRVMLSCVVGSIMSLCWAMLFMTTILLVTALFMVQTMTNYRIDHQECEEDEICSKLGTLFGSVLRAMLSLMMSTTGGVDWSDFYYVVAQCGPVLSGAFLCYIIFFQFAFFNIVTSMFVDKAMKLAKPDEKTVIAERMKEDQQVNAELEKLFEEADDDGGGNLTIGELQNAFTTHNLQHRLEMLGIPVRDHRTFFDALTASGGKEGKEAEKEVDKETFVKVCLFSRGNASGLDAMSIRMKVEGLLKRLTIDK